jgi:hypothetical protein
VEVEVKAMTYYDRLVAEDDDDPNEDIRNNLISDYWIKNYVHRGHCSLCGNTGKIDTTGIRTPAGWLVGRVNYCICPNGQVMRRHLETIEEDKNMSPEEGQEPIDQTPDKFDNTVEEAEAEIDSGVVPEEAPVDQDQEPPDADIGADPENAPQRVE